jgi:hypothetical protein
MEIIEFIMAQENLNADPSRPSPPHLDANDEPPQPPQPPQSPDDPSITAGSYPPLPEPVVSLAQAFVCAKPASSPITIMHLIHLLPPRERGWSLLEAFYENAAWFYAPLRRDMFIEIIFSFFYKHLSSPITTDPIITDQNDNDNHLQNHGDNDKIAVDTSGLGGFAGNSPKGAWARIHSGDYTGKCQFATSSSSSSTNKPHNPTVPGPAELSILFMVLTIGSLVDLSQPISSASLEADRFYSLAKAALCLERPLEEGCTTAFIQAINMMCCYSCQWSAKSMEVEKNWAYVGLATRMALSVSPLRPPPPFLFFSSFFY